MRATTALAIFCLFLGAGIAAAQAPAATAPPAPSPTMSPRPGRFRRPLRRLQRPSRRRPHQPATAPPRRWPSTQPRPTPRARAAEIPSCGPTPRRKSCTPTETSITATPSTARMSASLRHRRRAITPPSDGRLTEARRPGWQATSGRLTPDTERQAVWQVLGHAGCQRTSDANSAEAAIQTSGPARLIRLNSCCGATAASTDGATHSANAPAGNHPSPT